MSTETEIKLRLPSRDDALHVLQRCREAGGVVSGVVLQRDEYFDTRDGDLQRADMVVRLRTDKDGVVLAMKLARVHRASGVYERVEIEVPVADDGDVRGRLERQGLVVAAVIEKERQTAQLGELEIAIDHLPHLGYFVEVEASDENTVLSGLTALGLAALPRTRENYGELLEREVSTGLLSPRPDLRATFGHAEPST